jgi:membrane-bound metal-dependent hydrolase YbcI (DUF457 family)
VRGEGRVNVVHHLLYGAALANASSRSRRERRWIMLASIAPDVDGVTIWSQSLWEKIHHTFGHNVFFAAAFVATAAALARPGRRLRLAAATAFAIVVLHLALDLAISGTWPMRPLWPLSTFDVNLANFVADPARLDWWLRVPVQWTLMAVAIALALHTWRRHHRSALELFSVKLDELFTGYLARTLSGARCAECGNRAGFRCASCHRLMCGAHSRVRSLEAVCAHCAEAPAIAAS